MLLQNAVFVQFLTDQMTKGERKKYTRKHGVATQSDAKKLGSQNYKTDERNFDASLLGHAPLFYNPILFPAT
jgi:hypothetical protein